jgi:hypothetical protein
MPIDFFEEFQSLLSLLKAKLPEKDVQYITDLLNAHEWGIALEDVCTQLHEHEVQISPMIYNRIQAIGAKMNMTTNAWKCLDKLVSSTD